MHNFVDDNILSAWRERVSKVIDILGSEGNIIIDSFTKNEMIINLDTFQAIIMIERYPIFQTSRGLLIIKLSSQLH